MNSKRSRLVWLVSAVLAFASCSRARDEQIFLRLGIVESLLNGTQRRACRFEHVLGGTATQASWISLGEVFPGAGDGDTTVRPRTHCGNGSPEQAAEQLERILAAPHTVITVTAAPDSPVSGSITLQLSIDVRRFSGLGLDKRPEYRRLVLSRDLQMSNVSATAILPLFISPDVREEQMLGVHEVLLEVTAEPSGNSTAVEYGSIAVSSDIPGAGILIDGGLVGRVTEGTATVVGNVVAGRHDVVVRAFSEREKRSWVLVSSGRISEVSLPFMTPSVATDEETAIALGRNAEGFEEHWRVRDGAVTVRIPSGEFRMGEDQGSEPDERPLHIVRLKEFDIDKTEVTWRQLRKFTEATGEQPPPAPLWGAMDEYAVTSTTWDEAAAYCAWVGGRLPTEAEWEKAARGTDARRYPWGNEYERARCNTFEGGPHRPVPVGSFAECRSPYGVLDLAGSVWEWCSDWYGSRYYAESPLENPSGPSTGRMRVLRGGAWVSQHVWLRSSYRMEKVPSDRFVHFGFRCAQDVTG